MYSDDMVTISPMPTSPATSASSPGDLFQLIRQGTARSRSELSKVTGLAPSTVSLKVEDLLRGGLVIESGVSGRGGRTARRLSVNAAEGFVVSLDLGASHVRVAVADLAGLILADRLCSTDVIDEDPGVTVSGLWRTIQGIVDDTDLELTKMVALAVGVPAPVRQPEGRIVSPAFMPAWNNATLSTLFATMTDVPVIVENDANLYAIAECPAEVEPESAHLLAIKLGTRIGCGIISGGKLHRGFSGAAGEISHTQAKGQAAILCSCNVVNCLESVASGGALLARLRADGLTVGSTQELVQMGEHGDARAVQVLREAGSEIGAALSSFVNFFNPRELVLGGTMCYSAPLTAAIRAELFRTCLPLMTENLDVRTSRPETGLGSAGGLRLALDTALQPERVNALLSEAEAVHSA
ncbi:putative NBD/HSP70 family sugar kinase [Compostimonas suwonensis]|uniref:Putative NBD/HSP70 family sugar kinase n=2 Tax=Compostimonas suwonensis TaxID=1048394 RepID=A0A2M9C0G0_9MICO|nr:putative NBD/HSP70 family sugar kinase [Compostimonas suwonensis]